MKFPLVADVENLCILLKTSIGEKFNIVINFSGKIVVGLEQFFDFFY